MSRLPLGATLAALLLACAASGAGAEIAVPGGTEGAGSPAHCTAVSTGADTHTDCSPSAPAPQGSAIVCHNYATGADAHAQCAPVAAPRLSLPGDGKVIPAPPAQTLRCFTYHIGSSVYTDCR
jgi:hypothetical protein